MKKKFRAFIFALSLGLLFASISWVADAAETIFGAAMDGRVEMVRAYLDKGADINAKDNSGLISLGAAEGQLKIAVDRGFKEDIKRLEEVIRILKTDSQ